MFTCSVGTVLLLFSYQLRGIVKGLIILLEEHSKFLVGAEVKGSSQRKQYWHFVSEEASSHLCRKDSRIFHEFFITSFLPPIIPHTSHVLHHSEVWGSWINKRYVWCVHTHISTYHIKISFILIYAFPVLEPAPLKRKIRWNKF